MSKQAEIPQVPDVGPMANYFKALGDDSRLKIFGLLAFAYPSLPEISVLHLQKMLGLTQSRVSRHLSVLKSAGVVTAERKANRVIYRLAEPTERLAQFAFGAAIKAVQAEPGFKKAAKYWLRELPPLKS